MVLPDSTAHNHAAHLNGHSHHHEETKNVEYSALEAQFFEYNQISDAFSSVGFGGYDLLQHQPSNEYGLALDLMNLPPPYAAHSHSHPHNSSNHHNGGSHGMDMESSPLYTPMEAMSINPTMTMSQPSANPNVLQHSMNTPGSTQSHQIPLPPSPTGSTASSLYPPHHHMRQSISPNPTPSSMHPNNINALSHSHPHPQINTQMMHSPMGLMSSDLSAGALSSACSSAGSPESHRGGVSLPAIEQRELRDREQLAPAHGRTGSNASEKANRYNPMKGARSSPVANGGGNGNGRMTRKRAGTTGGLKKEEIKALKEEDHDSDDDDLDFAPSATNKSDKREEIRKQRIESEQRRRDELREGYRRLKEALPSSNQKSSKVALLDRAVNHVRYMEMTRQQLQVRLNAAEMEMARLRQVNEALMLGTAEQRAAAAAASAAVQAHVQPQY